MIHPYLIAGHHWSVLHDFGAICKCLNLLSSIKGNKDVDGDYVLTVCAPSDVMFVIYLSGVDGYSVS